MPEKNIKNYHRAERIVKGFANHRRIQILELIGEEPELSILDISKKLRVNFRTISEHIRRMAIAGLLMKRSSGNSVRHKLTDRGKSILMFLRTLE
jgi:predicted transcriptional regulator